MTKPFDYHKMLRERKQKEMDIPLKNKIPLFVNYLQEITITWGDHRHSSSFHFYGELPSLDVEMSGAKFPESNPMYELTGIFREAALDWMWEYDEKLKKDKKYYAHNDYKLSDLHLLEPYIKLVQDKELKTQEQIKKNLETPKSPVRKEKYPTGQGIVIKRSIKNDL